jgi:hypothetical protein
MNRAQILSFVILEVALLSAPALAEAEPPAPDHQKPQVMILGTFHFRGSATDGISVTMGDVLAPDRQAEIEEVVERLATFRPTKIMVERTPDLDDELNAIYRAWRTGERELDASESQQIAMRLAGRLGHEKLYAVDHQQGMNFQRIMEAGQAAGQEELLGWFQATMTEVERRISREQAPERSILDALRFHNSEWAHEGNGLYLHLALFGSSANPAGAEEIAAWYARN